jgi:hypothetical protein
MNGTFHHFNELPWELRGQIWNLAVRPAHPGVHVFKVYNSLKDTQVDESKDIASSSKVFHTHHLAAPVHTDATRTPESGWKDTLSTYRIDGGLWTACKESRRVMERNFKSVEWDTLRKHKLKTQGYMNLPSHKVLDIPATGYFSGDDDDRHYFTVMPHRDLFLLQPHSLETIDWSVLYLEIPITSPYQGFEGMTHFALEYQPEWGIEFKQAIPHQGELETIIMNLVDMAFDSQGSQSIWFVDYNLTRRDDAPVEEQDATAREGVTFYANDRRLVEVECGSEEQSLQQWRYIQPPDRTREASSIDFVRQVQSTVETFWDMGYKCAAPCSVGLLGWDDRL